MREKWVLMSAGVPQISVFLCLAIKLIKNSKTSHLIQVGVLWVGLKVWGLDC